MDPGPAGRRGVSLRFLAGAVAAFTIALAGCGGNGDGSDSSGPSAATSSASTGSEEPSGLEAYSARQYKPNPAEEYPNGKRLAARVAQAALTYEPGASAMDVARSLPRSQVGDAALARAIEPAVHPDLRSVGEVVYPQLSGVTETSLGTMVITRQLLENSSGERESLTRVLDVRLRLNGGSWSLEQIGSVGGSPVDRPPSLPGPAERILDSPRIELSDSARWDIYRGQIDPSLLDVLATAAKRYRLTVGILSSGHPTNVWATSRPSAHSQGFAADIYEVDGRPVVEQGRTGSPAYRLAQEFAAGGAYQLGSPWVFADGGGSSFTDAVHADHLHLQQSPAS